MEKNKDTQARFMAAKAALDMRLLSVEAERRAVESAEAARLALESGDERAAALHAAAATAYKTAASLGIPTTPT